MRELFLLHGVSVVALLVLVVLIADGSAPAVRAVSLIVVVTAGVALLALEARGRKRRPSTVSRQVGWIRRIGWRVNATRWKDVSLDPVKRALPVRRLWGDSSVWVGRGPIGGYSYLFAMDC